MMSNRQFTIVMIFLAFVMTLAAAQLYTGIINEVIGAAVDLVRSANAVN